MLDPIEQRDETALKEYLETLDQALNLPTLERAAICEEVAAHLRDMRAKAAADEPANETAASDVLRRSKDPRILGRELTRASQHPSAVLVGAGAGALAAMVAAARGLILGIAVVATVLSTVGVLAAIAFKVGLIRAWDMSDAGWFTAMLGVTLWFAAWMGGRSLVAVLAQRSHRRAEQVRPYAALPGLLVAWLSLFWLRAPQNLGSVVILALVPIIFAAAAMTGSDLEIPRSSSTRRASLALFATVVVAVPLLLAFASAPIYQELSKVGSGPYASINDLRSAQGFDMPGRFVPDPPAIGAANWVNDQGVARVELDNASAVTARWHDLRVEAWRADLTAGTLDHAFRVPFATSPMNMADIDTLVGSVRVDQTRDVSGWWLVVTGRAADGGRDLIVSLGGTNTTFTGSAMDWLTAE